MRPAGRCDLSDEVRTGFSATFPIHPHMLRHACGFKLANQGVDTRSLQHYLGHKNIQHTVRYTDVAGTVQRLLEGLKAARIARLRLLGNVVAAPPSSVMNSRRFIRSLRRRVQGLFREW
jgi:integrase